MATDFCGHDDGRSTQPLPVLRAKVVRQMPPSPPDGRMLAARGACGGCELVLQPGRLNWYAAGLLQQSYPVHGEVLQVALCRFRKAEAPHLCILQPRLLHVHSLDGETHTTSLPVLFTDLFPLETGLLLTGGHETAPKVLPLPEEDLQPVPTEARAFGGSARIDAGHSWVHDSVVWEGGPAAPFAVTQHRKSNHLRLWHRKDGQAGKPAAPHEINWKTPQHAKLHKQVLQSPASGGSIKRPGIRMPNGALSPAVFSPTPMTASGSPLPPVTLLPPPPVPFTMQLLAEQQLEEDRPTSGTLFHDLDGSSLLALHFSGSGRLIAIRLPSLEAASMPGGFEVVFKCEAVEAVAAVQRQSPPLQAGSSPHRPELQQSNLLLLGSAGSLRLHAGATLAFSIALPPPQQAARAGPDGSTPAGGRRDKLLASPGSDISMDASEHTEPTDLATQQLKAARVTEIQAGAGGQAILVAEDGQRSVIAVDILPPCELIRCAFEALHHSLPGGALAQFVHHLHALPGSASDCPAAQWDAFSEALRNWATCALPRRGSSGTAAGTAWEMLRQAEDHRGGPLSVRYLWAASPPAGEVSTAAAAATPAPCAADALQALHAFYEDCKLHVRRWAWLPLLARLLERVAAGIGAHDFVLCYRAELGLVQRPPPLPVRPKTGQMAPASIHAALSALLLGLPPEPWLPSQLTDSPSYLARTLDVLHFFRILAKAAEESSEREPGQPPPRAPLVKASQRLVLAMVERGWHLTELTTLPFGLQLPLRDAIARCREQPPAGWPLSAYQLVGRPDIAANLEAAGNGNRCSATESKLKRAAAVKGRQGPPLRRLSTKLPQPSTPAAGLTHQRSRLSVSGEAAPPAAAVGATECAPAIPYAASLSGSGIPWGPDAESNDADSPADGMASLDAAQKQRRFGPNLSLEEVRRLLQSVNPIPIHIKDASGVADAEMGTLQQKRLMALAVRTMALPVGRAALTLGTLTPLPTEPLDIPQLNLAGTLPQQQNAVVKLDLTATTPAPGGGAAADFTAWPEFHNGVAAGMRLAPGGAQLTRTWIVYNKPKEPSYTHAGMLMGLGLTGHLTCLAATDLFRYLSQEHDATTAGVLLGMAAARRGSCDAGISKMLFLHVPTRHPAAYPELELSPLVQAAALLGVGLLHQGSCQRLTAEIMLDEIGRKPGNVGGGRATEGATTTAGSAIAADREGYALSAGLALGLICLGQGRNAAGLADMRIEERLRFYMAGGKDPRLASRSGKHLESPAYFAGSGEPGAIGFDPTLGGEMPWGQPGMSPRDQRTGSNIPTAPQGQSQLVVEGNIANLDVTAPGATLALGLMYLMTNDASVAAAFAIPSTHFELDFVRPDFILLRMLARSLVMWDSVGAGEEWLLAQLPPLLRGPLETVGWGPTGAPCGQGELPEDPEAVAQAHVNALTGALLSIGIRFAGSADSVACATLTRYVERFLRAKMQAPDPFSGAAAVWGRLDKQTLENCMGVVAVALSLVMAGTGHLPTFKLLRGLRRRLSQGAQNTAGAVFFGNHMAVSMALGFLFYGGGGRTLATTKPAVAALVISLFPRFPLSPTDNRCHLQAFRHLHVLASEPRCVEAVEVDTRLRRHVPLRVFRKGSGRGASETELLRVQTPCLLPELSSIERLEVEVTGHYPLRISRPSPALDGVLQTGRVFVCSAVSGDTDESADPTMLASETSAATGVQASPSWVQSTDKPGISEVCAPLHALKAASESQTLPAAGPLAAALLWNLQLARQAAAAMEADTEDGNARERLLRPKFLQQIAHVVEERLRQGAVMA